MAWPPSGESWPCSGNSSCSKQSRVTEQKLDVHDRLAVGRQVAKELGGPERVLVKLHSFVHSPHGQVGRDRVKVFKVFVALARMLAPTREKV